MGGTHAVSITGERGDGRGPARPPAAALGERIRLRRKELGLTQSGLGGAELTKGFISLVEKGRANPSIETLILLARRLQKPVAYFLDETTPLGRRSLQVALAAGWVALKRGEFAPAAETFSETLRVVRQQHEGASEAECLIGLASALVGLREPGAAREHVRRGMELAETARSTFLVARAHHVLGMIEHQSGDLPAARAHYLDAHRLLHDMGNPDQTLAGGVLLQLGDTFRETGDAAEAARWYGDALALLEPAQDLERIGLVHLQIGVAQRDGGRLDAALEHFARAEHIFELLADGRLLAQARASIGVMLLERGETDEAIAQFERSLAITERDGNGAGRVHTLIELARALAAKQAFDEAERALDDGERLAAQTQDPAEAARIALARARLLRARGNPAEAITQYRRAITALEGLALRSDLARACTEVGEVLLELKRPSEAAPYLARALQEFKAGKTAGRS